MKTTIVVVKLVIMLSVLGTLILSSFAIVNALQDEWKKAVGCSFMAIIIVFIAIMNYKGLKYLEDRNMYWGPGDNRRF